MSNEWKTTVEVLVEDKRVLLEALRKASAALIHNARWVPIKRKYQCLQSCEKCAALAAIERVDPPLGECESDNRLGGKSDERHQD